MSTYETFAVDDDPHKCRIARQINLVYPFLLAYSFPEARGRDRVHIRLYLTIMGRQKEENHECVRRRP